MSVRTDPPASTLTDPDVRSFRVEVAEGNHFAAWQEPELFVSEVRDGFRSLR